MKRFIGSLILVSALTLSPVALSIFCLSAFAWECPDGDNGCEEDCGGTGCEEPEEDKGADTDPEAEAFQKAYRLIAGCDCDTDSDCADQCGGNGDPEPVTRTEDNA